MSANLNARLTGAQQPSIPTAEETYDLPGIKIPRRNLAADINQLLAPQQDGSIVFSGWRLTQTGLLVEDGIDGDSWQALGAILLRLEGAIQWLIGDWMAFGEREWGVTYAAAAQQFGYAVDTLHDYAYVCRSVHFSVRTEKLSFGHHKLVAALDEASQQVWLNAAAENGWSISRLRSELRGVDVLPEHAQGVSALSDKQNRRAFMRLWRSLSRGLAVDKDDVERLELWLQEVKRLVR